MKNRVLSLLVIALCISLSACGTRETCSDFRVRRLVYLGQSAEGEAVLLYDFINSGEKAVVSITVSIKFSDERNESHEWNLTGPFPAGHPIQGITKIQNSWGRPLSEVEITTLTLVYMDGTELSVNRQRME